MGSRVECFMLERTDQARRSLRRFAGPKPCPLPMGYHDAAVVIVAAEPFASEWEGEEGTTVAHGDPRWPTACGCGYVFEDSDSWQENVSRLYRDPRNGDLVDIRLAPPGAMHSAPWFASFCKPPDGVPLAVRLPCGSDWLIDGPANNAPGKLPGWERTGVPPKITARPSIGSGMGSGPGGGFRYHGFLTDGWLEEC